MGEYVGFYWTRPVNWAGLRKLPKDVDEAARNSKTIRYQCERVRRWVESEHGTLSREFVFIEHDPEEATAAIRRVLEQAIELCQERRCAFIYVNFGYVRLWRRHRYMWEMLKGSGLKLIDLHPIPLTIDGQRFDPIEHFEKWRDHEHLWKDEHRQAVRQAFAEALVKVPEGRGRFQAIADYLNDVRCIETLTGLQWTDETVRKFMDLRLSV
ncbi:hypothetical protein [Mesorhizobium sp.]|uniref:hypothetical protein n=1 Tax=Mesorhizobium sp. TaxID=1871066 RepID=UPI000FE68D3A|nr:hypothetical protein [Mesorhizobium sp.]RWO88607.1 MAG: hypothetical protein EOQ95_18585 [Mesorhizobium sp.]